MSPLSCVGDKEGAGVEEEGNPGIHKLDYIYKLVFNCFDYKLDTDTMQYQCPAFNLKLYFTILFIWSR